MEEEGAPEVVGMEGVAAVEPLDVATILEEDVTMQVQLDVATPIMVGNHGNNSRPNHETIVSNTTVGRIRVDGGEAHRPTTRSVRRS